MNKKIVWILAAVAFVAVIVGIYFLFESLSDRFGTGGGLADVNENNNPLKGNSSADTEISENTVPDFTVYDAAGQAHKLSDFFGKPIVLNLWASWCAPCKNEMPGFQQMYDKYGEQVHFLMVNVTGIDSKEDGQAFIRETGYSFPVYYDTDNSMAANYYPGSVPMTYFIGSNGELVTYATGAIPADILEQGIGKIVE